MSQENVELVRRIWEAVDRRDSETVLSLYDSEVELDVSGVPLVAMEAKEFIDAGGDELVVRLERHGRSRRRGLDFEGDWYWVYTMRQGRVVRIREFDTRQQVLESPSGLRGWAMSRNDRGPKRFDARLMPARTPGHNPRTTKPPCKQGLRKVSEGTRTPDRLDHNQELYQLSYAHRVGARV